MTETTARTNAQPVPAEAVDWLALGAALVTVILWASAFVGIRAVADVGGALCIGGVIVARSRGRLRLGRGAPAA
jgi:hypothetical protein